MSEDTVRENAVGRRVRKQIDLTERGPRKSLLVSALPLILGSLSQWFYNMADSMVVGDFVGEDTLVAAGASYTLTNVFIMIVIGGGNGASVLTSQYLGAKQHGEMKTSISASLITFLAVSLVLGDVGFAMSERTLEGLDMPENIMGQARLYLRIYFLGLPFLSTYNMLVTILNTMGGSRAPLYLLIFSPLLNVVLDIIPVTWLGVGVGGVTIATVIAQGVSTLISFAPLLKRLKGYAQGPEDEFRFCDTKMLGSGTKIAVPSILQQSVVSIRMSLVQLVVNGFGSAALAGYSADSRIESIRVVPVIAAGNAVATFTTQNIGAGKLEWVKKGYRTNYGIIIGFSVLIAVVVSLTNGLITASFLGGSMSPDTHAAGTGYLSFIAYFFVLIGLRAYTNGLLRGFGDMLVSTIANLVNLVTRVFDAFHFVPVWGVAAVWYAAPTGQMTNYVISFARYPTGK